MNDTLAMYAFRVGDHVMVKGWPPSNVLEVIDTSDRALLTLQTPSGATLKVGRLQVTPVNRTTCLSGGLDKPGGQSREDAGLKHRLPSSTVRSLR